jgi:hypothetical protein
MTLGLGLPVFAPSDAWAQAKAKPAAKAKAKPKAKNNKKKGEAEAEATDTAEATDATGEEAPKTETKGTGESEVKAAGTESAADKDKKKGEPDVVKVEESKKQEGVKTYTFSAIEVEGRLKSPQIIYFLRRVRAEFEAGLLGHRSFMPELSDSRRSPALR